MKTTSSNCTVPMQTITPDQIELIGLRALVRAADRAIGDHNAPSDCYATGPMTGDHIADLVECPACIYLAMRQKFNL